LKIEVFHRNVHSYEEREKKGREREEREKRDKERKGKREIKKSE